VWGGKWDFSEKVQAFPVYASRAMGGADKGILPENTLIQLQTLEKTGIDCEPTGKKKWGRPSQRETWWARRGTVALHVQGLARSWGRRADLGKRVTIDEACALWTSYPPNGATGDSLRE